MTSMDTNSAYGIVDDNRIDQENSESIYDYPYTDAVTYTTHNEASFQPPVNTFTEPTVSSSTEQPKCDNEEDIYSYIV